MLKPTNAIPLKARLFRALSDEVGRTMAIELLTAAGLTVEQVADRLGYADAASLTRAFKRWTGTTPGAVARAGFTEAERRNAAGGGRGGHLRAAAKRLCVRAGMLRRS